MFGRAHIFGRSSFPLPPQVEKAFAKLHQTYSDITGGNTNEAFQVFLPHAAPGFELRNLRRTDSPHLRKSNGDFPRALKMWLSRGWLASTSSNPKGSSGERERGDGLYDNHAYALLRVVDVRDDLTLVQLRNPHGSGEWNGESGLARVCASGEAAPQHLNSYPHAPPLGAKKAPFRTATLPTGRLRSVQRRGFSRIMRRRTRTTAHFG